MAWTKEQQREYNKKYYVANREKLKERSHEQGAVYRADNKEKIRERTRKYNSANREKLKEKGRKYHAANPEKARERTRKWRSDNREKQREIDRKWREANREKITEQRRKRYAANPEKYRKVARDWAKANPEKVKERESRRVKIWIPSEENRALSRANQQKRRGKPDSGRRKGVQQGVDMEYAKSLKSKRKSYLKKTYKLTLEEWNEIFDKQKGCCAICGNHHYALHTDHDHTTNEIRGLLCRRCNLALGGFLDDIQLLQKAIAYLQSS